MIVGTWTWLLPRPQLLLVCPHRLILVVLKDKVVPPKIACLQTSTFLILAARLWCGQMTLLEVSGAARLRCRDGLTSESTSSTDMKASELSGAGTGVAVCPLLKLLAERRAAAAAAGVERALPACL